MAQLTIKINGYAYNVGCEDGQEQHLQAMCDEVERRVESIKKLGGNSSESHVLVLAALLMADENHDLRVEVESLRSAKGLRGKPEPGSVKSDHELTRKLGRLAIRAEQIAAGLEQP